MNDLFAPSQATAARLQLTRELFNFYLERTLCRMITRFSFRNHVINDLVAEAKVNHFVASSYYNRVLRQHLADNPGHAAFLSAR